MYVLLRYNKKGELEFKHKSYFGSREGVWTKVPEHWVARCHVFESPPIEDRNNFGGFISKIGRKKCPVVVRHYCRDNRYSTTKNGTGEIHLKPLDNTVI